MLWVLIGWQFTLAEFVGGIVMIVLMTLLLRLFVSRALEREARAHARAADTGHQHQAVGEQHAVAPAPHICARLVGRRAQLPRRLADDLEGDHRSASCSPGSSRSSETASSSPCSSAHAPAPLPAIENVLVGPIVAVLSFVCSVGNVPLAAVLWSGGISFGGVLAFLFADLIVLPIILIYRKYYGTRYALRTTALMFVTMVLAAVIVDGIFTLVGLVPTGPRPTRADIFSSIQLDYKLWLNVLGFAIFAALFRLTARRGATDPVCGMKVDRDRAVSARVGDETVYFCSEHCRELYSEPDQVTENAGTLARR